MARGCDAAVRCRASIQAIARDAAVLAVGSLVREIAHLPFYTSWSTGSPQDFAVAVLHCTGGDVLIGTTSLAASPLLLGVPGSPRTRFRAVANTAIAGDLGTTILSEHVNTAQGAWARATIMPTVPGLGTGMTPLLQWLVAPLLAVAAARPRRQVP